MVDGNTQKDLGHTDTGIKPNVAALFSYLLGFVTGLIFILIEKQNKFVRFHAMQSIVVFGALFLLNWFLSLIPAVGALISGLVSLASLVLWIVLMVKAYQGEQFKLPIAGELAEKNS